MFPPTGETSAGRPRPESAFTGVTDTGVDETSAEPRVRQPRGNRFLLALWRWWHGPALPVVFTIVTIILSPLSTFVFPAQNTPARSDVVFVIGPPDSWRIDWAKDLVDDGLASAMMISVPQSSDYALCAAGSYHGVPVYCATPDPFTTQGEARWLQQEMADRGWSTATVITVTTHIVRTRLYFDRCIPAGVAVVGRATSLTSVQKWVHQIVYQLGGTLKAVFVTTGC